jgi:hypothetical protein
MIVFRQKVFNKIKHYYLKRAFIKGKKILWPVKYANPNTYVNNSGKKVTQMLEKDIARVGKNIATATKDTGKNIKDIGSVVTKGAKSAGNISVSTITRQAAIPLNPRAAMLARKHNIHEAAEGYSALAKTQAKDAAKHVGSILKRTPTATIGPAIPVPGATEALGVVGPYVDKLTPLGELIRAAKSGAKKSWQGFKNIANKSRNIVL